MRTISIIKYAFLIISIVMLAGAFWSYTSAQSFLRSAVAAEDRVVDLVRSRSSDSTTYRPVVELTAKDGALVEFTSSTGSNPPSYSKGEVVEVLY